MCSTAFCCSFVLPAVVLVNMQVMSTPIKAALERVAHQKLPLPYPPDHETKGQQLSYGDGSFWRPVFANNGLNYDAIDLK